MKLPSTNLVHALLGKAILETLLVGSLAVFAFLTVLPPNFRGWGEVTDHGIAGWAVNGGSPWERVEVRLFIDGNFFAPRVAKGSGPDVPAARWALDEWHGYTCDIGSLSPGHHEALVYAMRTSRQETKKSLQQVGTPIPFIVGPDGIFRKPPGA